MNINMFPTKGNLIAAKNSLALARQGYDLMDKKRNILVREMMDLVDQASTIQTEIDTTFRAAYECRDGYSYGAGHREDSSSGKHCKDQDAKHHGY